MAAMSNTILPTRNFNLATNSLFFQTIENHLKAGSSVIAEAAFQRRLWQEPLEQFSKISLLKLIVCSVPNEVMKTRFLERIERDPSRDKVHADSSYFDQLENYRYQAPEIEADSLTLGIQNGYNPNFETVIQFLSC